MSEKVILPFISPTTVCVVGPSQSGKSFFTKRLIENAGAMFTKTPEKILYAYSEYQKMFDDMLHISNLSFHEGLPDREALEKLSENCEHSLVILDDLMSKVVNSEDQLHLFTVTSHHKGISCIYMTQNMYMQGKYAKTIALNSANFVLLRNPRDMRQLITFASQILPGQTRYFTESYLKATKDQRYSYLLVDISPHREDNQFMLRSGIFPGDTCVVYKPS